MTGRCEPQDGGGNITLVLGGARSGKSRYAEEADRKGARAVDLSRHGGARDDEMERRIAEHRARRDRRWRTIEAPHDLAAALAALPPRSAVLVDCLTLWLSDRLLADGDIDREIEDLERALAGHDGAVAMVSNDVGSASSRTMRSRAASGPARCSISGSRPRPRAWS